MSVGGFVANLNTDVRIGTPSIGTTIDPEDTLGLESSQTVVRVDAVWRFGDTRRHRLDFTWFDLSRDGTRNLTAEINVDGTVYPIGTVVDSKFDLAFYNVRYGYSFILDERVDLAASIGLHVTKLGLAVSAAGIGTAGDAVTAPLPVVGFRLDVALTEKWYFRSSVEALYLKYGDFEGSITDVMVAGEYRAFKNFAVGAGINAVRLKFATEGDDLGMNFRGDVKSNFVGLMLYGKVLF